MDLPTYLLNPRAEVRGLLPARAETVLDIGCGPGGFGITLRAQYPLARLVGVEPEPSQARSARQHFDVVHEGFFPRRCPRAAAGSMS